MPDSPVMDDEAFDLLTPAEVLAMLRISRRTLERYIDRGELPAFYLPGGHRRFKRSEVEGLLSRTGAA